jgi:hypothetical protein
MPKFYKFMNSRHIDAVLTEGTLIISSLQYFRDLEKDAQPWIGDRFEGASELRVPDTFVLTEGSQELDLINQANIGFGKFGKFANVSSGGVIDLSGTKFLHLAPPDVHLFVQRGRVRRFEGGHVHKFTTAIRCLPASSISI